MGPIVWLIVGAALVVVEIFTMDFAFLMLGLSAFAAAGVALANVPAWLEVMVFALSSLITLMAVRPMLKKKLGSDTDDSQFTPKELEGRTATVIEPIASDDSSTGMIKIGGDFWSAAAAHVGTSFDVGETVEVLSIEGTTAIVWKGV